MELLGRLGILSEAVKHRSTLHPQQLQLGLHFLLGHTGFGHDHLTAVSNRGINRLERLRVPPAGQQEARRVVELLERFTLWRLAPRRRCAAGSGGPGCHLIAHHGSNQVCGSLHRDLASGGARHQLAVRCHRIVVLLHPVEHLGSELEFSRRLPSLELLQRLRKAVQSEEAVASLKVTALEESRLVFRHKGECIFKLPQFDQRNHLGVECILVLGRRL
mmetsp:Transcript_29089/g.76208  ORF Transcript_29089/g.76208 Transcript_29089/m.76208 type:complete len:218 (-) Transcript_29089:120-773(-)